LEGRSEEKRYGKGVTEIGGVGVQERKGVVGKGKEGSAVVLTGYVAWYSAICPHSTAVAGDELGAVCLYDTRNLPHPSR
jgi:hypothetical protein